ncbi:hypothetical protein [Streptomyces naphthomycinicus]|uniref:hypothetical protein n=1 Tax=Streptomyces naphthomycinicus TaxID=2872625 RepID=UPI001CED3C9D|nr:hypothetical protein [Streptomyces sp. TML10]
MKREELLATARRNMWTAWALSAEEMGSQAADTLYGLGMLVAPGEAAELVRLRKQVDELEAQRDRRRVRLIAAEADLLGVRGLLAPADGPRRIPGDIVIHERVAPAVEWLLDRVAELEAERHSTNEALSDAAETLGVQRDRIAELERHLAGKDRPVDEDPIAYALTDKAAQHESRPLPSDEVRCGCGHPGSEHHHVGTSCWARLPRELGQPVRICPCKAFAPVSVEESAERLARFIAPLEDPHDSPLSHTYRLGRDLPQTGGA